MPHLRPGRVSRAARRLGESHLVGTPHLQRLSVSAEPELEPPLTLGARGLSPPRDSGDNRRMIVDDIAGLRRILLRQRTFAVVGLSANWYRPSFFAAKYLQDHGYR